jgi:hypothetical protein
MLTYGLPAALRNNQFAGWLKTFFSSKDVIFDLKDPLPALLQFRGRLTQLSIARKNRISLLEASTFDIEWNGEM